MQSGFVVQFSLKFCRNGSYLSASEWATWKTKHSNQSIWRIIESSENRQFEKQKWKPLSIECNDSDNARNAIRMPYNAMEYHIQ